MPLTHISSSGTHIRSAESRTGHPSFDEWLRNSRQLAIDLEPFVVSWPSLWHIFCAIPISPSPPRSQTSDDVPAKPAGQNKAWQVGVRSSASGSLTCTYISLFVLPFGTSLTDSRIARTDRPEPSPSRSQARAPRFHMHPLLSYTRLHHAPISYDVAFTPSARTVVDRTLHSPLPAVTLAQPVTEPPILASSHLPQRHHLRHHCRLRQMGSPSRCGHIHRWAQMERRRTRCRRSSRLADTRFGDVL